MGDPAGGPEDTAPATAKTKSGDPVQAQNWGGGGQVCLIQESGIYSVETP